jgi:hypothetical protein
MKYIEYHAVMNLDEEGRPYTHNEVGFETEGAAKTYAAHVHRDGWFKIEPRKLVIFETATEAVRTLKK